MSNNNQSRNADKIFGSVKIYNKSADQWVYVRSLDTGDIKQSIQTSDHNGWLLCDGRSLSKQEYSNLFSCIGYAFGGSGNSFNLPDTTGKIVASVSNTHTLGQSVGSESHTLSTNELPSHSHTGTTNASGSHSHTYNDAYYAEAGGNQIGGNSVYGTSGTNDSDNQFRWRAPDGTWSTNPQNIDTSTAPNHTHTFTTQTTGNGQQFSIMQPTIFIGNTFIFA